MLNLNKSAGLLLHKISWQALVAVLLDDQGYVKLEPGQTNMQGKWETFVANGLCHCSTNFN